MRPNLRIGCTVGIMKVLHVHQNTWPVDHAIPQSAKQLPSSVFIHIVWQKYEGEGVQYVKGSFYDNYIKQLGFHDNSIDNNNGLKKSNESKWNSFYFVLCHIKISQIQSEPEYIQKTVRKRIVQIFLISRIFLDQLPWLFSHNQTS